jgi:hypothetical protein
MRCAGTDAGEETEMEIDFFGRARQFPISQLGVVKLATFGDGEGGFDVSPGPLL